MRPHVELDVSPQGWKGQVGGGGRADVGGGGGCAEGHQERSVARMGWERVALASAEAID